MSRERKASTRRSEREQQERNKEIDDLIKKDASLAKKTVKLLLLGTAECGKSTILKQMRLSELDAGNFNEHYVKAVLPSIFMTLLDSMYILIAARRRLGIQISKDGESDEEIVITALRDVGKSALRRDGSNPLTKEVSDALRNLWLDDAIQKTYSRNNEFQFFLDQVDRLSRPNYTPSQEDVLRSRVQTQGIVELRFKSKNSVFLVVDVGGQRSARKKWIHCFDDVQAVIFVVAMSEFDQVLTEDNETNRMHESLNLFEQICQTPFFYSALMILFLNKKDVFEQKLRENRSIDIAFPNYTGKNTFDETSAYLKEQYIRQNNVHGRQIFAHYTCATDTQQVKVIIQATLASIIHKNANNVAMI